jgi:glycosyltransferase involved in cell wall biosynthesis
MRIAFSARGLSIPSGGVRQFILSLVPRLASQIGDDELFVFYNRKEFLGLAPGSSEIFIKGNNRILWDFLKLPRMLRKLKIDAAIFPKNTMPFFTGCDGFVVIHDLAYFEKRMHAYLLLDTLYMRMFIPSSVRRAAGIFAVSENTKKEIVHYTRSTQDKVIVTHEAAERIYRQIKDQAILQRVKEKYKLPEKYIMYVGSLSPRKNIVRLLEAFAKVRDTIEHKLVLTASKSWNDSEVYVAMKRLNLDGRILKIGYVQSEEMPALYNLADLYVYPSLYEGFGLPVLEAMQCGCPVVASNVTSLPEVAGDAAILIDPLDTNALAESIVRVLSDLELREKLITSGFKQADKFSWDRCANIMLETVRRSSGKAKP